jgi:hypothetical protein
VSVVSQNATLPVAFSANDGADTDSSWPPLVEDRMYDSKSFAKVLLEFAREILKDIGEGQPSDAQLRTLDAISLVLDKQLHRNGENMLITELELLLPR